jgi:arylsulfatase A-like enzyme
VDRKRGEFTNRESLIIATCVFLQGLPFFLTSYPNYTLARFYYPIYWDHLLLYLLCIPVLVYVEISVLLLIVEGAKHHLLRPSTKGVTLIANRAVFGVVVLIIVLYPLVITASWYFYSQTGYFLGPDTLSLFPMLFDFTFISGTFAPPGLIRLAFLLMIPVGLGIWLAVIAPRRNFNEFLRLHGRGMLLSLLVAFILALLPKFFLPPAVSGVYRATSFFALSPQWSVLWAYLRYGRFEPRLPSVSLNLVERREVNFTSPSKAPRKHVFLFVVEGLRFDAVSKNSTPTLHRLAQEGINFHNSYSQSTETSESMLSIITGRYPLKSPLRKREGKNQGALRVYDGLARAGYTTGYIGEEWSQDSVLTDSPELSYRFNPFAADYSNIDPQDNPFRYRGRGLGDYSLAVADRLKIKMLQKLLDRSLAEERNVFSIMYLISSHFPYDQTDGVPSLYRPNELTEDYNFLWYPKHVAPIMHNRYLNTVAYIDSLLDRFLVFLKERNQLANSIIIITGDHGQSFGEHDRVAHSRHLDQEAIRVPLIIWGADGYDWRWEAMAPVSHVDIAPTIYYLLGLAQHPSFQGESVLAKTKTLPLESTPQRPLFMSTQALMHEDAIILWPWKFVRNLWGEAPRLYRLDNDPHELKNIFDLNDRNARLLCDCVVRFRASQFYYYDPLNKLENRYFPPKYNICPDITLNDNGQEKYCGFK